MFRSYSGEMKRPKAALDTVAVVPAGMEISKRRPMISTVICTTVMSGMCGREIQTGMKKCIIVSSAMQSVGISYSAILRGTCYHGQHKNCSDLHWQRGSSEGLLQCQVWIHIHIMIGSNEFGVFLYSGKHKVQTPI